MMSAFNVWFVPQSPIHCVVIRRVVAVRARLEQRAEVDGVEIEIDDVIDPPVKPVEPRNRG